MVTFLVGTDIGNQAGRPERQQRRTRQNTGCFPATRLDWPSRVRPLHCGPSTGQVSSGMVSIQGSPRRHPRSCLPGRSFSAWRPVSRSRPGWRRLPTAMRGRSANTEAGLPTIRRSTRPRHVRWMKMHSGRGLGPAHVLEVKYENFELTQWRPCQNSVHQSGGTRPGDSPAVVDKAGPGAPIAAGRWSSSGLSED